MPEGGSSRRGMGNAGGRAWDRGSTPRAQNDFLAIAEVRPGATHRKSVLTCLYIKALR